ncbi:MAG: hypothetical protein R2873_35285 [Caldilineaceae bacterium]
MAPRTGPRAAVVEASIFIGSGGFYFAKLSGEASARVRITNGNFNPIINLGWG